jgi:hypothetical protein
MSSGTEDGRVCIFWKGKHFMSIKKSVVQSKIKLMLKQVFVTQARPKNAISERQLFWEAPAKSDGLQETEKT